MQYLMLILLLINGGAIFGLLWQTERSREERKELEDRLMAICHPVAQTQISSERSPMRGTLSYVNEEPYSAILERDHTNANDAKA
jgi:hypothetical protein